MKKQPSKAKSIYCEFCGVRNEDACKSKMPTTGLLCTRREGHSGPHVACAGSKQHKITQWEE